MAVKIAINGMGRIGRLVFRQILDKHNDLELAAVNDLADCQTIVHLLKFDSTYGVYSKNIKAKANEILINGNGKIPALSEKNAGLLPWAKLGIDIVLECTGVYNDYDGAGKHLKSGAKKVIISAASKNPEKIPSFVLGVNEEKYDSKKDDIVDMGSCTTNCLAPVAKVLNDELGIIKGFMSTVHSYTNDQRILDLSHEDLRRARSAGLNIIPTTTGAVKAISNIVPELKGKLNGLAFRVPTATVSLLDLVCETEKTATSEEVNYLLKKASQTEKLNGILGVEDALLVSSDYKGNSFSAVIDSSLTMAIGNMVKVVAWYDNEWAYASRLAELASFIAKKL